MSVLVVLLSAHPAEAHEGKVARGSDGWNRVGEGSLTGTANASSLPRFVLVDLRRAKLNAGPYSLQDWTDLMSQHNKLRHACWGPRLAERRAYGQRMGTRAA